jgi:hypothetical protein
MNDKVIQVFLKGDQVIGITETGYLARFDENLGVWITRGRPDVLDSNSQVVVNHVTVNNIPSARIVPVLKNDTVDKTVKSSSVYVVCAGVMAGACLLAYLIIHFW